MFHHPTALGKENRRPRRRAALKMAPSAAGSGRCDKPSDGRSQEQGRGDRGLGRAPDFGEPVESRKLAGGTEGRQADVGLWLSRREIVVPRAGGFTPPDRRDKPGGSYKVFRRVEPKSVGVAGAVSGFAEAPERAGRGLRPWRRRPRPARQAGVGPSLEPPVVAVDVVLGELERFGRHDHRRRFRGAEGQRRRTVDRLARLGRLPLDEGHGQPHG